MLKPLKLHVVNIGPDVCVKELSVANTLSFQGVKYDAFAEA